MQSVTAKTFHRNLARPMPLTISHPIAIVPLWFLSRKKLDLSSLAVGAMIPDISYFLALRPVGNIGHSALGVLVQGIPASLVLLWIFYRLMNEPLRRLSPSFFGRLLPTSYAFGGIARFTNIVLCIALGAATHILWDGFTHRGTFFVEHWPLLEQRLLGFPIYKLLQYGGGVFGLVGVSFLVWRQLHRADETEQPRLPRQIAIAAWLMICLTIAVTTGIAYSMLGSFSVHGVIVQTAVGTIAGTWAGFFLYSFAFQVGLFTLLSREQ